MTRGRPDKGPPAPPANTASSVGRMINPGLYVRGGVAVIGLLLVTLLRAGSRCPTAGNVKQPPRGSDQWPGTRWRARSFTRRTFYGTASRPFLLNRRTWDIAIRTINAAIPFLGLKLDAASFANVNVLAGILWHGLGGSMAALGACDRRLNLDHGGYSNSWRILIPPREPACGGGGTRNKELSLDPKASRRSCHACLKICVQLIYTACVRVPHVSGRDIDVAGPITAPVESRPASMSYRTMAPADRRGEGS